MGTKSKNNGNSNIILTGNLVINDPKQKNQ